MFRRLTKRITPGAPTKEEIPEIPVAPVHAGPDSVGSGEDSVSEAPVDLNPVGDLLEDPQPPDPSGDGTALTAGAAPADGAGLSEGLTLDESEAERLARRAATRQRLLEQRAEMVAVIALAIAMLISVAIYFSPIVSSALNGT